MVDGQFHADSAVSDKAAELVEHRFAAHTKLLLLPVGIDATQDEVQEWLSRRDLRLQFFPLGRVPADRSGRRS